MVKVHYSEDKDVYYLHDYIRERDRVNFDSEDIEMSEKIILYKDGNEEAIDFFTRELMEAIAYLSNNVIGEEVTDLALVSIPPSEKARNNSIPMKKSIRHIKKWFETGEAELEFACKKGIYNFYNTLERIDDVKSAHKSKGKERPTISDHRKTIRCNKKFLSKYNKTFILLDDITTTGTIMKACTDILYEDGGAVKRYIYRLAIAQTKWCEYE